MRNHCMLRAVARASRATLPGSPRGPRCSPRRGSRGSRIIVSVVALAVALFSPPATPADGVRLRLALPDRIRISERTNLSRRDDGRYAGLRNRQVTGYLTRQGAHGIESGDGGWAGEPEETGQDALYAGRFLVFDQTRRDMQQVGRPVDWSVPARLALDSQRAFTGAQQFPPYVGVPFLPDRPVHVGDTWDAPGAVIVELPHGAPPVVLPVVVAYRYEGTELFEGTLVHRIEAGFTTRYPLPQSDEEDEPVLAPVPRRADIMRIAGRHVLTVLIPAGLTGTSAAPLFIRDELEEQYELAGEPVTHFRGHTLLFVSGLSVDDQRELSTAVREQLTLTDDIDVVQTDTGTRLTIRNIRFVADQAVILPAEQGRLEQLARVLAALQGVRFLVVGHTADVGSRESQLALSRQRADVIVQEMVRRGLDPLLFDVEGRGGTEPIATNDTEHGRAQNRRVEIFVLEQ